jgi:hypothetical protein
VNDPPHYLLAILAVLGLVVLVAALKERRLRRRAQRVAAILDLADRVEAAIREGGARLRAINPMVAHMPPPEPTVKAALQELLRHRLWLKQNAASASDSDLAAAHDRLHHLRVELDRQLERLLQASTELDHAFSSARRDPR